MKRETILNQRYQILELLGSGGMAVVYKARDLTLGRLVAIKILRAALTTDPQFLQGFLQEARAAANLAHPNIVTVHDFGFDQENYYLVMEFVEGQDLKTLLQSASPLPVDEALELAIQMCEGVGYAHRAGLVHCDLKPQNMLLSLGKRLKVADFGLARVLASIQSDENNERVWGTPQYFAPEQAAGQATSPASDVYSLGVVTYEMLAGRLPFLAETPADLARAHVQDLPPLLTELNPRVPQALAHIIQKVLAKEPSARYRTADQLGRILLSYRNQAFRRTGEFSTSFTPVSAAPALPQKGGANAPLAVTSGPAATPGERLPLAAEGPDWVAASLAFLAFLAVVGLVPLWVWVGFVYEWF